MRRPVPSHRNPTGYVPPLAAFEPFIDRNTNTPSGHWYWDDDFKMYDFDRFAVLRAPLGPHTMFAAYRNHNGLYVVVRALWAHANNAVDILRVKLFNTCGSTPCVNPAHVEREIRSVRVTLPVDVVMYDGVGVRLRKQGPRVHIVPVDVEHAVCGWRIRDPLGVPAGTVITCVECVSMWRARGYPLQDVP